MANRVKKTQLKNVIHIRVSDELIEFLEAEAEKRLLKSSDIVRQAIMEMKERSHGRM